MNAPTPIATLTHNAPFFQVPRQRVQTSQGAVELPILYYDTSTLNAFFLVDKAKVEPKSIQVLYKDGNQVTYNLKKFTANPFPSPKADRKAKGSWANSKMNSTAASPIRK